MADWQLEDRTPNKTITGPQGPQGPMGPQGPQGVKGNDGSQGPKGDQGAQGFQGPQGAQGPAGATGPKGDTGRDGPQGPQGLTGPRGAQGVQGDVGPRGNTGPQGQQGPQGGQGVKGDTGDTGATGPKGDQGVQGVQGPKGDQGIQGPQGVKGDQGAGVSIKGSRATPNDLPATGNSPGDTYIMTTSGSGFTAGDGYSYDGAQFVNVGQIRGPQGPQGVAGNTGAQGPKGDTGAQGAQGPKGDTGAAGANGADGAQGIQGPKGDKGDTGAAGAQGVQGPKGDTGAQGAQGVQGPKGDTGAQGPKGDTGAQGATGPAPDTSTYLRNDQAQGFSGAQKLRAKKNLSLEIGRRYYTGQPNNKVFISAADLGGLIYLEQDITALEMPLAANYTDGDYVWLYARGQVTVTVAAGDPYSFGWGQDNSGSFIMRPGDRCKLMLGADAWGVLSYSTRRDKALVADRPLSFSDAEIAQLSANMRYGLTPPGVVADYAGGGAPAGWLKCNGAAVSRTAYAALFATIGTFYGAGDGSTTFNLPDSRGYFRRSLDEGRGIDANRTLGSTQADAIRDHLHSVPVLVGAANGSQQYTPVAPGTGGAVNSITNGIAGGLGGIPETRPQNIAFLAIIKY